MRSKGELTEPRSPWESFRFRINGYVGVVYSSGKVVYHEPLFPVIEEALSEEGIEAGSDEAGKGEKTGPIVIAAVALDPSTRKRLRSKGLLESKSISRGRLEEIVTLIRKSAIAYATKIVYPDELSLVWRKGNLNDLLAKWHFEVVSNVLSRARVSRIIIDSFGRNKLEEYFSSLNNETIEVIIEPKADEKYATVAAASLLAKFLYIKNEKRGVKWA